MLPADKRILILLDNKSLLKGHIKDLLETNGFICESTANSRVGLFKLQTSKFLLVIIDHDDPKGGLEFLNALGKKDYLERPLIILLSSTTNKPIRKEALSAGAYAVLEKPFKNDELLLVITRAIKRYAHTVNARASLGTNPLQDDMTEVECVN